MTEATDELEGRGEQLDLFALIRKLPYEAQGRHLELELERLTGLVRRVKAEIRERSKHDSEKV